MQGMQQPKSAATGGHLRLSLLGKGQTVQPEFLHNVVHHALPRAQAGLPWQGMHTSRLYEFWMLTILGSPSCSASCAKRITPYDVSLDTPM